MADERYTFTQAKTRLEDIVVQVRKKDVSLERSLDLLEEGVRLASSCTELIDHTEWRAVAEELQSDAAETEELDSYERSEATGVDERVGDTAGDESRSRSTESDDGVATSG